MTTEKLLVMLYVIFVLVYQFITIEVLYKKIDDLQDRLNEAESESKYIMMKRNGKKEKVPLDLYEAYLLHGWKKVD